MKKIYWVALFALNLFVLDLSPGFAQHTAPAAAAIDGLSPRQHQCLDEDWKFAFGNAADPAKDFNYSLATIFSKTGGVKGTAIDPAFNDSSWSTLQLPHDWAVELPFVHSASENVTAHGYKPVGGAFPNTSIGWYRKRFSLSGSDSGHRFQLQFDGVFRDAAVWINGFYLGDHKSGYTGVTYDITDYLHYDGNNNVVTVRVDATQYEGWFYEGAGIYRHVWLNRYDNLHLVDNGVFVHADVQNNKAIVTIESTIDNESSSPATAQVSARVTDRDGRLIGTTAVQTATLNAGEQTTVRQTLTVSDAQLWSIEHPYLYRVTPLIRSSGRLTDSQTIRFGIRTIAISSKGLFLNGQYVKLHGTNNHQDHAGLGTALPDYLYDYRVRLLKAMGVNAYRTSHGAPAPELLDACDSLGMLVLDENRLLNSSPQYLDDFKWLLRRDRSRASVFAWSIGNEEGWVQQNGIGRNIAKSLLAVQRSLDPTRLSTYAADVPNVYHGINEVIPIRGFNYRQFAVEDYHRDHPDQPLMGTEMGSTVSTRGIYSVDSIHGYLPDQDITAPWWASRAETWWPIASKHDWWMGGFIWTGFDYRGEPTPFEWPVINSHFGMMDMCGFPKNIYYYYQSWWTDLDVLHISPHWNWRGREGQPIDVWVNSNAERVELFLNGKSLGEKPMPRDSHLQWSVPYAPGTLEAVAWKKGRRLSAKAETTNAPYEVVVTPYKTTFTADGRDVSVINISVLDREGREVPDASNLIRFAVKGDAHIIGVGNGDPSSHEADKMESGWQRALFNGHCQVILQSGKTAGFIHFEALSDSLQTGSTDILSIHPGSPHSVTASAAYLPSGHPALSVPARPVDKMLGADISFLPQLEARGMKFKDKGQEKDAISILKDHGINYIRLRLFNDPSRDSGYSPGKGFCDLDHTIAMARRVKKAGLKWLLDFHYSDYWADPQKQFKPAAWRNLDFAGLEKAVYNYTREVLQRLKAEGVEPDMVQVGNEINHGLIWPEGQVGNLDSLAGLLYAGINAVRSVSPSSKIMIHIALGGQNDEARFFLDNMIGRGLTFDVIGLSFYPRWHGTTEDLRYNMASLAARYNKDVIVVEYSHHKQEVNDVAFTVPGGRGKGTCIWEPLSTWEKFFDKDGNSNELIGIFDDISKKYLHP
jgi:beta-galactosidase